MNAVKVTHLWACVLHAVRSGQRVGSDRHCNAYDVLNPDELDELLAGQEPIAAAI